MACWARTPATGTQRALMSICDTTTLNNEFALRIRSTGACRFSAAGNIASSSTTLAGNTWGHFCGVGVSGTSRLAYLNGGGEGSNTPSSTPTGLNATLLGVIRQSSGYTEYHNGDIEWPAIWNVALTRSEIWQLSRGLHPSKIRPANLVFIGDTETWGDWIQNLSPYGSNSLEYVFPANGPSLMADEPPMIEGDDENGIGRYLLKGSTATTVTAPVVTHTYTAQAPQVKARVQPGAVTHTYVVQVPTFVHRMVATVAGHTYVTQTPQAKASVMPATVAHTYTAQTPQAKASVMSGVVTHTYVAQTPQVKARVQPGAVMHTYVTQTPTISNSGGGTTVSAPVVTHVYDGRTPQVKVSVMPVAVTHTYITQTPQVKARVQPAAVTHTYTAQTPQAKASVMPGVVTHVYTGRTPTPIHTVQSPVAVHVYTSQTPKASASVMPPAAAHTYTGRAPTVFEGAPPVDTGGRMVGLVVNIGTLLTRK